jgi:hypothetical protein
MFVTLLLGIAALHPTYGYGFEAGFRSPLSQEEASGFLHGMLVLCSAGGLCNAAGRLK